jgi:hypothetical protein
MRVCRQGMPGVLVTQPHLQAIAQDLRDGLALSPGIAHCLHAQGAVPPYGSAYLWARFGDLDCEGIWAAHRGATLP